jgi:hypothetical protein
MTHAALKKLKRPGGTLNEVIRFLLGQAKGEVYVDIILVDNSLPQLHTVVFQLGEDKESVYLFDGSEMAPTTLEHIEELMKQPKTMPLTRREATIILGDGLYLDSNKDFRDRLRTFAGV